MVGSKNSTLLPSPPLSLMRAVFSIVLYSNLEFLFLFPVIMKSSHSYKCESLEYISEEKRHSEPAKWLQAPGPRRSTPPPMGGVPADP